jgi:hypothetical protein
MNALLRYSLFAFAVCSASIAVACEAPCETCVRPCVVEDQQPSWIFNRSTYSHDPVTGARVAQYERIAPVEPLEDERNFTSSYRFTQTNLRGADGSVDRYYQVQAWGNGRGGMDAEWERFHDAWKESILAGGYYNQGGYPGPYSYNNGYGNRFNGNGYGRGRYNGGWGQGGWNQGNGGPGPWQSTNGGPWQQGGGNWNGGGGPPQGP